MGRLEHACAPALISDALEMGYAATIEAYLACIARAFEGGSRA